MAEQIYFSQTERLADRFHIFHHVFDGVLARIFQFFRAAGSTLVNKDEFVGARQGHEVGQEIIMRGSRPAVYDHQRSPMAHDLVVDQRAVGVHKTFLNRINIAARRARSSCLRLGSLCRSEPEHENAEKNKGCNFHAAHYNVQVTRG